MKWFGFCAAALLANATVTEAGRRQSKQSYDEWLSESEQCQVHYNLKQDCRQAGCKYVKKSSECVHRLSAPETSAPTMAPTTPVPTMVPTESPTSLYDVWSEESTFCSALTVKRDCLDARYTKENGSSGSKRCKYEGESCVPRHIGKVDSPAPTPQPSARPTSLFDVFLEDAEYCSSKLSKKDCVSSRRDIDNKKVCRWLKKAKVCEINMTAPPTLPPPPTPAPTSLEQRPDVAEYLREEAYCNSIDEGRCGRVKFPDNAGDLAGNKRCKFNKDSNTCIPRKLEDPRQP
mmetsp:Transcript_4932/g.7450  ORF Transcript_4932/g.7450 Transcript_4932/m.7450 type:complete len:289 (+) Transcript_4932:88-954(+)